MYTLRATPRRHSGKVDNEVCITGLNNKIKDLNDTESLDIKIIDVVEGRERIAYGQFPVSVLREYAKTRDKLYLRPWKSEKPGARTLVNTAINRSGIWGQYISETFNPNKSFVQTNLVSLMNETKRNPYVRELSDADKYRNHIDAKLDFEGDDDD